MLLSLFWICTSLIKKFLLSYDCTSVVNKLPLVLISNQKQMVQVELRGVNNKDEFISKVKDAVRSKCSIYAYVVSLSWAVTDSSLRPCSHALGSSSTPNPAFGSVAVVGTWCKVWGYSLTLISGSTPLNCMTMHLRSGFLVTRWLQESWTV